MIKIKRRGVVLFVAIVAVLVVGGVASSCYATVSSLPRSSKIKVTSPKWGDVLEIGKTYNITWDNYLGTEELTIALEDEFSAKIIVSDIPASFSGSYSWVANTDKIGEKHRFQVYPSGGREYVGRSASFAITDKDGASRTRTMKYVLIFIGGIAMGLYLGRGKFQSKTKLKKTAQVLSIEAKKEDAHKETQSETKLIRKVEILKILHKKGSVINNDIEKTLKVSDASATNYLQELEDEGKIKQVGKTGVGVYYELK